MTLTQTTDHAAEAVGKLIQQFKGKENLEAFVQAFSALVQDMEDTLFDLLLKRTIELSEGAQLDGLGEIVGIAREGKTDALYRNAIQAQILLNISSGTPEEIMTIIGLLLGSFTDLQFQEYYPLGFHLLVKIPISTADTTAAQLAKTMNSARDAAVQAILIWFEDTPVFQLDTAGSGLDEGHLADASSGM